MEAEAPPVELTNRIAERMRVEFNLSGDSYDQLILETAREVDRQEEILIQGEGLPPKVKSDISAQRGKLLALLEDMAARRAERIQAGRQLPREIAVSVLRVAKAAMSAAHLEPAVVEAIVGDIVTRLDQGEHRSKARLKRVG